MASKKTAAQRYLEGMEKMRNLTGSADVPEIPKVIWRKYYGWNGEVDRRTGRKVSKYMYLGFADGSRVRNVKGGTMQAI